MEEIVHIGPNADLTVKIIWSDLLEFSSDGLRYDAFPDEYRGDFGDAAAE